MADVSLTAKPTTADKKLVVDGQLSNHGGKKIYVFSALWVVNKEGKTEPDPRPAYASIDDKRMLHLGKIIHPVPKEKFIEQRFVPFAKPLAPGEKWEEKLELELPIQEYNPYYLASEQTLWDEVALGGLRLCVDWLADVDGLKLHETPIDGAFRLEHRELLKLVQRSSTAEVPIKAAALRRPDKFERFTC